MSFAADIPEGAEILRQLLKYDGVIVSRTEFGRLTFSVDVGACPIFVAQDVIDEMASIDPLFDTLFVSGANTIDFDFYVTADLLPKIRRVVDKAEKAGGRIFSWSYRGR